MINYISGDLFSHLKSSQVDASVISRHVIVHIVNDVGAWGRGFVLNLSRHYPEAEKHYKTCWKTRRLGDVDVVRVDKDVYIANVFGQRGLRSATNGRPVDYDAVIRALYKLKNILINSKENTLIHMPRIGCGLGGGKWEIIEKIISRCLSDFEVNVYEI